MQVPNTELERILNEVIRKYLIPKHEQLGQKATGKWVESLEVQGNTIRGQKYTEQLVFGRKPNRNTDPKALRKWAFGMANYNPEFKRWLQFRGLTQFGIQIAYKLGLEGSKSLKSGGSDLLEVLEKPEVLNYINSRLADYINVQVKLELQRQFQTI